MHFKNTEGEIRKITHTTLLLISFPEKGMDFLQFALLSFFSRCRRERQVDHREADEDHPRDGLQLGRVPALPTRRLLQHHPEPPRHHLRHEQAQDRLPRQVQAGECVGRRRRRENITDQYLFRWVNKVGGEKGEGKRPLSQCQQTFLGGEVERNGLLATVKRRRKEMPTQPTNQATRVHRRLDFSIESSSPDA